MTRWLVRWRLALRISRREALRARGRTALVLLMIGLPILVVVGADTLYRTGDVTAVEALPATLGAADARLTGESREPIWADPRDGSVLAQATSEAEPPWQRAEIGAALPAGSEVVEVVTGATAYRTEDGARRVRAWAGDLGNPLLAGTLDLDDGRFPRARDEVAVSEAVAARGVAVGDELAVTEADLPFEVVGIVRGLEVGADPFVVLPSSRAALLGSRGSTFYADTPGELGWSAVQQLNQQGLVVLSRSVVTDPPDESEWTPPGMTYGGGLGTAGGAVLALVVVAVVVEVVLLAGPAFAVGARRQRRDLALLAATGGDAADLRRVVLASGLVLGGGAALLGAALGVLLAAVAVPVIEAWSDLRFGPFDVPWLDALITVAAGVVAGLAAAWFPARQAARTDVTAALAGRRGQVRTSWRLPVVGMLLASGGLVAAVLGARGSELGPAAGAVLLIAGFVVMTPWLVGLLAPLGGALPPAARLAVRDATRNRSRTAPAVAAVLATVAGVTVLAIANNSDSTQSRRDYLAQAPMGAAVVRLFATDSTSWADVERVVADRVPGHPVEQVQTAVATAERHVSLSAVAADCPDAAGPECYWFPGTGYYAPTLGSDTVVVDVATLAATTAPALRDQVVSAFEEGRAVVFGDGAVDATGQVTLQASEWDGSTDRRLGTVALPATEITVTATDALVVPALVVVPPLLADRLPVPLATSSLIVGGPDAPVTAAQERQLREGLAAVAPSSSVYVERGWTDALAIGRVLLLVVGGLLVLVATLTATGLALTDARPDFATMAAIGAPPRTRRLMAMGSAAVVGGLGAVLGVLAGLAPGIAVAYPLTSNDYGAGARPIVDIPWLLLTAVAVAVPLLAVVVTGLAVRSRLPMTARVVG